MSTEDKNDCIIRTEANDDNDTVFTFEKKGIEDFDDNLELRMGELTDEIIRAYRAGRQDLVWDFARQLSEADAEMVERFGPEYGVGR